MTGLVTQMLDDENLQQGNALNGLAESGGGIVGPALAGVIVATSSPGWAVLVDALTYLISVGSLAMVRVNWSVVRPSDVVLRPAGPGLAGVLEQDLAVGRRRGIVPVQPRRLRPVSRARPGGGEGPSRRRGIVGNRPGLARGRRPGRWDRLAAGAPRRPLFVGLVTSFVWAIPLLTMALRPSTALIAVGSFLGGGSMSVFNALWNTTVQRESSDRGTFAGERL